MAAQPRLMILSTTTGYQTQAFVNAAHEMGVEVAFGSDRCHVLEDPWRDGALALHFEDPEGSAFRIAEQAQQNPVQGIVALGDRPVSTLARACQLLRLPGHPIEAADICRDKYRSRERLRAAGLNVPQFARFPLEADPRDIVGPPTGFPCVLKPLALSASRGVIRANNREEFVRSFERIRAILRSPDVQVMRERSSNYVQVESYIEGREIAVEGLVDREAITTLAIFDKPDPLEGPYFEETLYVTPSRLEEETQREVVTTLERAIRVCGLFHGPFHAELRLNARGVWPLEIAARSIGGLCSKALRFSSPALGEDVSLEKLLIALALGWNVHPIHREQAASGVMMIPIEREGIYQGVEGVDEAREVPGVTEVVITAKPGQRLVPLPEGCSYLGFIFARAGASELVENALRKAHCRLRLKLEPVMRIIQGTDKQPHAKAPRH